MIYQENPPIKIIAVIVLVLAFILIYSPWCLGIRELLGDEGRYAAMALEMKLLNPSTLAHGETLEYYYPLYPWLVAIAYKLGFSYEVGLRLVSVLCLAGIAVTVFVTSRRIAGLQEAIVSAAAMISCVIVMQKSIDGNPFVPATFCLLLGWLSWYTCGAVNGNWDKAWIIGSIFCGLAFYTIGWIALFYFYLPLIFMRRPLTIWKKLNCYGFKIGILIVVVFVCLWVIPRISIVIKYPPAPENIMNFFVSGYFLGLLTYPFELIWRTMPWTVLFWPAFCVAYQPLDKNPIFSRFLRTIFLPLFVVMWLSPDKDPRTIILLLPALSILCGINYGLAVRRNGYVLKMIFNCFIIIGILLCLSSFIMYLLPLQMWHTAFFEYIGKVFYPNGTTFLTEHEILGFTYLPAGTIMGIMVLFFSKRIKIWLYCLFVSGIFMFYFWGAVFPYRSQDNDARITATQIIEDIGKDYSPDMTIYKGADIADIYVLGTYLGCNIRKIHDYSELPEDAKSVYVLTLNPPIFPERQWSKVSSPMYKDKTIILWKGVKNSKKPALEI